AARIGRRERVALDLLRDDHLVAAPLHAPRRDRRERGSSQRLARAQTETGMVPGTTNCVADQQALGERPAVVAARGAYREEFAAYAREQHRLARRVAEQFFAVGELARWDSSAQVRSREFGFLSTHFQLRF